MAVALPDVLSPQTIDVELRGITERQAADPQVAYRNADRTAFRPIIVDVLHSPATNKYHEDKLGALLRQATWKRKRVPVN